jgi:hypothetical protein
MYFVKPYIASDSIFMELSFIGGVFKWLLSFHFHPTCKLKLENSDFKKWKENLIEWEWFTLDYMNETGYHLNEIELCEW